MKIIQKEIKPDVLKNGFDNYEEKKEADVNKHLLWLQQEASKEPVSDAFKINESTNSWYNIIFGFKLIASLRKRTIDYVIDEKWSSIIDRVEGDYIDYLTSVKLIDQYPFKKCDDDKIYIIPECSTSDERPHDFFIWRGKASKGLAIEIQNFKHHSKPVQKIKDFAKAQHLIFNPPNKKQFIPMPIAADQFMHEEYASVIDQMINWLLEPGEHESDVFNKECDIPF